jgi:site-specific DNA-methyltransferase (adenine-specific)
MITKGMLTSNRDSWETPQKLFDELNKEFNFTIDAAADAENHKCERYYTREESGLEKSWKGERVFLNPPYGRELPKWVKKAADEAKDKSTIIVMLIPARTDTHWFHDYIYKKAEIRFIKGRLKFGDGEKDAPFPSMVVIFGRGKK